MRQNRMRACHLTALQFALILFSVPQAHAEPTVIDGRTFRHNGQVYEIDQHPRSPWRYVPDGDYDPVREYQERQALRSKLRRGFTFKPIHKDATGRIRARVYDRQGRLIK